MVYKELALKDLAHDKGPYLLIVAEEASHTQNDGKGLIFLTSSTTIPAL